MAHLTGSAQEADSAEERAKLTKIAEAFRQAAHTGDLSGVAPSESRSESRQPANAIEAYKRNATPRDRAQDDVLRSAMDAAFATGGQAARDGAPPKT